MNQTPLKLVEEFLQATWDFSWELFELSLKASEALEELRIKPIADSNPETKSSAYKIIVQKFMDLDITNFPAECHVDNDQINYCLKEEIIPRLSILQEEWEKATDPKNEDNGEVRLMDEGTGDSLRLVRTTCLAMCEDLEMYIMAGLGNIKGCISAAPH
jgi:hypothetical protein